MLSPSHRYRERMGYPPVIAIGVVLVIALVICAPIAFLLAMWSGAKAQQARRQAEDEGWYPRANHYGS